MAEMTVNQETKMKARGTVKYLGVRIDKHLNWKAHINGNKTETLKMIEALARLTESKWGGRLSRMRQMMNAIFIPQLT